MNRFSFISLATAAATLVLVSATAHAAGPTALGAGEGTPGYPHEIVSTASASSRADVRAEAVRAVAEGRVASGEFGLKLASAPTTPGVVDRAQVRAEAAEAVRLGLVASGERSVVYTAPQLAAIKAAGERATHIVVAAQR